jgi:hypothetical protein
MKNLKFILPAALLALASCSPATHNADDQTAKTDSVTTAAPVQQAEEKVLFAKMTIRDTIKSGEPVLLKFTVYNNADSVQQFCKWHTPFEPLMSKYLDIKAENGEEVSYKGAMAKRMMPPPASSYQKLNSKDSLSADVDLLKGYDITKPAKYTVVFNSQEMSGLVVKDSVTFVYGKQ